ncbi:MAG TPA: hypothetical protein VFI90_13130, partial [Rubrobacter sp.]|nr:hypothetical protein [Rubrobacter sp.]
MVLVPTSSLPDGETPDLVARERCTVGVLDPVLTAYYDDPVGLSPLERVIYLHSGYAIPQTRDFSL